MLSNRSEKNLLGVHPKLDAVVRRAAEITTQPFVVLCGVRTLAEQAALYVKGRTAPGPKVTDTMNSRHLVKNDGFGHAVDIAPYPVDWLNANKFTEISRAMFLAAKELGVQLRWGADWDRDGVAREKGESDSPHYELFNM